MSRDNIFRDLAVCGCVIFGLFALNGSCGELLLWLLVLFGCGTVLRRLNN